MGVGLGADAGKWQKNMTDNKASKKRESEGKRIKWPREYFKGRFGDVEPGDFGN